MADFVDIEQITLRGGLGAFKFGDPYTWSGQAKLESDRWLYLYGFSGTDLKPLPVISRLREMSSAWSWKGLRWERLKEDGSLKRLIKIEF